MALLRVFLVLWLAMSVPTTALAGMLQQGHCRMEDAAAVKAAEADHSMHAGHSMDAGHGTHQATGAATSMDKTDAGCKCGCNCSADHCTSGVSGFVSTPESSTAFGSADSHALPVSVQGAAAAHHLDLLRPPARL